MKGAASKESSNFTTYGTPGLLFVSRYMYIVLFFLGGGGVKMPFYNENCLLWKKVDRYAEYAEHYMADPYEIQFNFLCGRRRDNRRVNCIIHVSPTGFHSLFRGRKIEFDFERN